MNKIVFTDREVMIEEFNFGVNAISSNFISTQRAIELIKIYTVFLYHNSLPYWQENE